MDKNDAQINPDDGLKLQGPLTGQISTIKVGIRPPDLPLIDRIETALREVKKKGGIIPSGSSFSGGGLPSVYSIAYRQCEEPRAEIRLPQVFW